MKKGLLLSAVLFVLAFIMNAQHDTMDVMKNGGEGNKPSIKPADVDSVIFYNPIITLGNTFVDSRDGNVYQTVTIGNQVWMAENLRYLPSVVAPGTGSQKTPYYYVNGYNGTVVADAKATSNYTTYGVLYNWPAAMADNASSTANPSGVQGVCPTGWHLPGDAEWKGLTDYLGEISEAGGKLKETGLIHWTSPNAGATNETGFTALPGGLRSYDGAFSSIGGSGRWWSATEFNVTSAWYRDVGCNNSDVNRNYGGKGLAFSVRCVRD